MFGCSVSFKKLDVMKVMKLGSMADTNICIKDDVARIISVALKVDKRG